MADRAKALARLAAVQKQVVQLAECRLAEAERSCREISENTTRLQRYVVDQGALGAPLARAALHSLHGLDAARAAAESRRLANSAVLQQAKQREGTADKLADRAARAARRTAEDRALAEVMEARLACKDDSLP